MSFLPRFCSADDFWPMANRPAGPAIALRTALADAVRWLVRPIATAAARFIVWRLQRRARRELMALDDRMLRDAGISREEIRREEIRSVIACRRQAAAVRRRSCGVLRR